MIDSVRSNVTISDGDFLGRTKPKNLSQAAEQFEAMFLRSWLKGMRKTADIFATEDGMFSSREARTVRDFYDEELASHLASQRQTGIAALLIKQLSASGSDQSPDA